MQDKQNENIRLEHMVRYVNVMDYYKMLENTWFYQPRQNTGKESTNKRYWYKWVTRKNRHITVFG